MIKTCPFYVLLLCSAIRIVACQRNRLNATALSNKLFTAPVDDTLNTVQITNLRGGRLPATRLFYSTVSNNNFQSQNPALPPIQPTFPTNSLFRGNDRRRKAPKKSLRNRKGCLSCLTDFKNKPYTHNDVCLNPLRNITEAELRFFNVCPETSEWCQIEVFTVNGVFSGLERRCSTICKPVCFQRSYGTETESCILCCPMLEIDSIDDQTISKCPVEFVQRIAPQWHRCQ